MSPEINLDSGKLRFNQLLPETAEDSVVLHGFAPRLRECLLGLLLAEKFDRQAAQQTIADAILLNEKTAIADTLAAESADARLFGSRRNFFTQQVNASSGGPFAQLRLPRTFLSAAAAKIQDASGILDQLEDVHASAAGQKYLAFLRAAKPLFEDLRAGASIDAAYQFVQHHVDRGAAIVSPVSAELLHTLLYLPTTLRYVVQEFLVNGMLGEWLTNSATGPHSEAERACIGLLKDRLRNQVAINKHWMSLAEHYGASEQLTVSLGERSLENARNLERFSCEVPRQVLTGVNAEYMNFRGQFETRMRTVDDRIKSPLWRLTDVNHCFSDFDYSLHYLAQGLDWPMVFVSAKNPYKAVILEDDPTQLSNWAKAVENNSPFSLMPCAAGLCRTVESIQPLLGDPSVGLYVLDIENGEDRTAGIRVAESLVLQLVRSDLAHHPDKTEIVVWTSSAPLMKEAKKRLKALIVQEGIGDQVYFAGGKSNARIQLMVSLKAELPFVPCLSSRRSSD